MGEFIRKAFSESGEPSSKRVVGILGLTLLHIVFAVLCARYGMTDNIQSFGMTLIVTDGSLLGISSITKAMG